MTVADNPRRFFWAQLVGSISLLAPVITLFYLHRGLTLQDVLIMFVIDVAFSLIFEIPTGVFADKYGHKASLIVAQVINISAITLLLFAEGQILFFIIAALYGISTTFHSGIKDAIVYESLKEVGKSSQMQRTWGRIRSAAMFGGAVAAVFGALIAKDLTEAQFIILIVLGLIFALGKFLLLFTLTEPKIHLETKKIKSLDHLKNGFSVLRKRPNLMLFVFGQMLIYIPFWAFEETYQPYLLESGLPVIFIGVLLGVTMLATAFLLYRLDAFDHWFSPRTWLYGIGVMTALSFGAAAVLPSVLAIAIAVFVILHVSRFLRSPFAAQITQDYIPSGSRATTGSLLSGVDSLFDILIVGFLAILAGYGMQVLFIGAALIVVCGLLFPIRYAKEVA